ARPHNEPMGSVDHLGRTLAVIGGGALFIIAALLASATIGVWRRKSEAPGALARVCILILALIASLTILASRYEQKQRVLLSGYWLAYTGLLLACAISGIKAAIDIKRSS